jgi:hypothetical protein
MGSTLLCIYLPFLLLTVGLVKSMKHDVELYLCGMVMREGSAQKDTLL